MASGFGTVHVEGLRQLDRALGKVSKDLRRGMRGELREAAEPVRVEAERAAISNIRNIGPRWSRMRVGVTAGSVYLAPASRRRRGSPRPNLAGLLVREAMVPAVTAKQQAVVRHVEGFLDSVVAKNGFWQ